MPGHRPKGRVWDAIQLQRESSKSVNYIRDTIGPCGATGVSPCVDPENTQNNLNGVVRPGSWSETDNNKIPQNARQAKARGGPQTG